MQLLSVSLSHNGEDAIEIAIVDPWIVINGHRMHVLHIAAARTFDPSYRGAGWVQFNEWTATRTTSATPVNPSQNMLYDNHFI